MSKNKKNTDFNTGIAHCLDIAAQFTPLTEKGKKKLAQKIESAEINRKFENGVPDDVGRGFAQQIRTAVDRLKNADIITNNIEEFINEIEKDIDGFKAGGHEFLKKSMKTKIFIETILGIKALEALEAVFAEDDFKLLDDVLKIYLKVNSSVREDLNIYYRLAETKKGLGNSIKVPTSDYGAQMLAIEQTQPKEGRPKFNKNEEE